MNFFTELKRRHVFRIGIAYLVVAWLLTQVVGVIGPMFGLPSWFPRGVVILLAVGFPVALIVAWAFELTPEGVKRTDELDEAVPKRAVSTGRKLDFVIIGALIMALGYFAWGRYYGGRETGVTASDDKSIAVLPFEDYSAKHDQGYFADGISEEILNSLAGVQGLQVTAKASSFYFKGRNEDLRSIGEKLGVENILGGSVRKEGDTVRITAQLNNARTGTQLWSKSYDRKMVDIFSVQENIAQSVAQAIGVSLGVGEVGRVEGMTRNPDAFDEFLKGEALANQLTADGLRQALDHLERAVAFDPSFALAWTGIADASLALPGISTVQSPEFWQKKGQDAISRAYELAPTSPSVLMEYSSAQTGRDGPFRSGQLYEKAVAASNGAPSGELAYSYGAFLLSMGRFVDATNYLQRARTLNPLDNSSGIFLGELDAIAGDMPGAFAEFDRSLKASKESPLRAGGVLYATHSGVFAALASGDERQIATWMKLAIQEGSLGQEITKRMQPLLDDPKAALADLQRLAKMDGRQQNVDLSDIAQWAAYFGDPAFALELLRTRPENRPTVDIRYAIWRPVMKNARKLPAFKDLVRDIGLVDYWRKSGHWADVCHPVGHNDFECE